MSSLRQGMLICILILASSSFSFAQSGPQAKTPAGKVERKTDSKTGA